MNTDNPTTGKWTVEAIARETVLRWRGKLSDPETFEYLYENILAAIQTAIAAEHELVKDLANQVDNLQEQLAAEQEKVAEVEDHNIRGVIHPDALAKHNEKLAAAVVAIKRMQGAAMDECFTEIQRIGDVALEKIGKL